MSDIESSKKAEECCVCLQICSHPTQLPCNHIFCFLCIKGAAFRTRSCPLCRSKIPTRFFEEPKLLHHAPNVQNQSYSWFYEGNSGWWQYEERTAVELEKNFLAGNEYFEIIIAGHIYLINYKHMTQSRKDRSGRIRRIKRDYCTSQKLGIAGIKIPSQNQVFRAQDSRKTSRGHRSRSTNISRNNSPTVQLIIQSPQIDIDSTTPIVNLSSSDGSILNQDTIIEVPVCVITPVIRSRSVDILDPAISASVNHNFAIPTGTAPTRRSRCRARAPYIFE